MNNSSIYRIITVALVISLLFAGCKPGKRGKHGEGVEETEKEFVVKTQIVESGDIADYIKLGGDVTTETNVDVYPEVQYGKIIQINVQIGQWVRKGKTIVVVDPSKPGLSYASNPIRAPISGYVTALFAQLGAVVNSQIPVVRIGVLDNPKDIYVKTFVPEKYISAIKPRMPADIDFSYSKEPYKAYVWEMSPVIDPSSRTFEIWLRFKNYDSNIKVGSYPDVKLYVDIKKDVVKIPAESVIERDGKTVVFLIDENKRAKKVLVETGIRIDGSYEIKSGLNNGDSLIIQGHSLLVTGSLVRDIDIETEPKLETPISNDKDK